MRDGYGYGYDTASITAQCAVADRLREAEGLRFLPVRRRRATLARVGAACVHIGRWLQESAQPRVAVRAFAEERVQ